MKIIKIMKYHEKYFKKLKIMIIMIIHNKLSKIMINQENHDKS